jgi:hypothetical protein
MVCRGHRDGGVRGDATVPTQNSCHQSGNRAVLAGMRPRRTGRYRCFLLRVVWQHVRIGNWVPYRVRRRLGLRHRDHKTAARRADERHGNRHLCAWLSAFGRNCHFHDLHRHGMVVVRLVKSAQTGLFIGAGIALLSVLATVYARRAVLEGTEIALYWFGSSITVASGLAAFLAGIGASSSQDRSAFVGFGIAAAAALIVAAALILRRRASLTVAEIVIYAFGGAIAAGYLVGCAFGMAGSTGAAAFFGMVTPILVWGGLGIYAWRRCHRAILLPSGS